ncbi:MAG: toxin-antitoxin system YwqK family antitoxin [Saprospiraceae bacterium]|nr:toxin-antitoxin system YwqK family antitoxin [Saprospiraceae bacterium]
MKFLNLFILVFLFSCKKYPKIIEFKNTEGIIVQRVTLLGDTSQGKYGIYEKYDNKGILFESANYVKGKLDGEKKFYEEGVLYSIENYQNDQLMGPYKIYYPNGQIQMETQYVNNEITGELKSFYPSGKLKEKVMMKANVEEGPFIEFFENGNKKAEGTYKSGENGSVEDGFLTIYDSTGTILRRMNCINGICNTIKNE